MLTNMAPSLFYLYDKSTRIQRASTDQVSSTMSAARPAASCAVCRFGSAWVGQQTSAAGTSILALLNAWTPRLPHGMHQGTELMRGA
jgi:hypothetical protein